MTRTELLDVLGEIGRDFLVSAVRRGNIPGLWSCARATLVRMQDRLISCCFSMSCLVTLSLSRAEITSIPWNFGVTCSKSIG